MTWTPSRRLPRRRPAARTIARLADARVPLCEGMMLANGHRVVEVDPGGALRMGDVRPDLVPMLVFVAGDWRWVHDDRVEPRAVPDLGDRGTWLLCLDELARRSDLDPSGGVFWNRIGSDATGWVGWRLAVPGGARDFLDPDLADISDDLDALAAALVLSRDAASASAPAGHRDA